MENMWNKHSLIQKTSVKFQRETEMLRGGLNTLYDRTDHGLSLPTGAWTCGVIACSVTTSSYQQICDSMFMMAQRI
jgi:hypothetical protein